MKPVKTNKPTPADIARYKRLAKLPDSAIDFSDAPELTDEELAQTVVVRGGKRAGAGRKATGHVQVVIRVSPRVRDALRKKAKREHTTLGGVIEHWLAA